MKKSLLISLAVFVFTANVCVACPAITTDLQREAKEAVRKVKEYAIEYYDDLISKSEDEIKESKQGNGSCGNSPENTKNQVIKTETFEYLLEKVLKEKEDSADEFLARTKSYEEARIAVKEKFFYESDVQLTERGEALKKATGFDATSLSGLRTTTALFDVLRTREKYANAVASKNLAVSMDLRSKIGVDLKSTEKVATSGCNQLQGMLLENRNLVALLKETASDLVVQILTLESLAARNLQKESPQLLIVPEKPKKDEKSKLGKAIDKVTESAGDAKSIVNNLSSVSGLGSSKF